jgi:hypothetical protein
MTDDERDAQGIAVDGWCWTVIMPELLRQCEKCHGEFLATKSDAVTVAMFCCYGCERAFSRVRSI